jgi:hypothetical protein
MISEVDRDPALLDAREDLQWVEELLDLEDATLEV